MHHIIILFYKYVPIENPEKEADFQRALCKKLNLKGRAIIAEEGINATYEGTKENIETYISEMKKDPRFADIYFKKSKGNGNSFPKLSIKVRDEIVSAHLQNEDVKPWQTTGKRLSPDEMHTWYEEGKKFTIVDMRNDYEFWSGYFEGSIHSGMENFRDLPKTTETIADLKNETVVTVCTGGVRCEKASGYLVSKGFNDVYQLDGGIVSYMEKYPAEHFKGSLYVFDDRVVMNFNDPDRHVVVGTCRFCGSASERYVNCANDFCHLHFIVCESCAPKGQKAFCKTACKIIEFKNRVTRASKAYVRQSFLTQKKTDKKRKISVAK